MSWFVFALGAGLASAINVYASKLLVGRKLEPILIGGVVHLWGGLLCLLFLPWFKPSFNSSPIILLSVLGMGVVYALGNALYFQALATTQLSEIDVLLRTSSFWTFLLAVLLLSEPAKPALIFGAVLIFLSVLSLSQQTSLRLSKPHIVALLAALTFGLGNVIDKALSPHFDALSYTALNLTLTGLGMLVLARVPLKRLGAPVFWQPTAWLVALTFALTQLFIILAFQAGGSAGQVILVAQVRLIILVGVGITVLNERDRLGRKTVAALLMLLGLYVLYR